MIVEHTVFWELARYTSQRDGTIVTCEGPVTLFKRGAVYLQETISWGFHPCQKTVGKDAQNWAQFNSKLLGDSRMKLTGPWNFRRVQTFKEFGYTLFWNNNVIHWRDQPTEKWDLAVFIFVEHIRKLAIKFLRLFNIWICNATSSSSCKMRNTSSVFFSDSVQDSWEFVKQYIALHLRQSVNSIVIDRLTHYRSV